MAHGPGADALTLAGANPLTVAIEPVLVLIANTPPVAADATKTSLPSGVTAMLAGEITCARVESCPVAADSTSTAPAE
ncbi:MAG: hypothetical protein ACRENC_05925 [Gemmatimonadaceae bacterium]